MVESEESEQEKSLVERAAELDETRGRDHALVAVIAGLNAVPVVGGVFATFISEYVPRRKAERVVEFAQDLSRALEAQGERLDGEFVRTAEFAGMVEEVLDRIEQVKNEAKLGYWATLLAGVATTDRPEARDRDRMIEALDAVRPPHLRLLYVISTTRTARPGLYMGGMMDTLRWKLPDVPEQEIRSDWGDLARLDLVQEFVGATMTAEGAGNLTVRLTDRGRRFVRILQLEGDFGAEG